MMKAVQILTWFLFYFSVISLIAGLVRPVYVLWFLDRMNRIKVIKIYGTAALFVGGILLLMEYYIE
tara:strand:- start:6461 stop:6658 length:198 start_codon:yes stop_codon:yes gene_type:complete